MPLSLREVFFDSCAHVALCQGFERSDPTLIWGHLVRNVVSRSVRARAPQPEATEDNAPSVELGAEFSRLLRLSEDTAPRLTHIARILAPEFTGHELARIRVSLGLSIEDVAYLASVTTWQVRHMEEASSTVRYRPSSDVLNSVRAALHFHIMRRLKRREGIAPERRRRT